MQAKLMFPLDVWEDLQPCMLSPVGVTGRDLSGLRGLSIYPVLTNHSFPASEFKESPASLLGVPFPSP